MAEAPSTQVIFTLEYKCRCSVNVNCGGTVYYYNLKGHSMSPHAPFNLPLLDGGGRTLTVPVKTQQIDSDEVFTIIIAIAIAIAISSQLIIP